MKMDVDGTSACADLGQKEHCGSIRASASGSILLQQRKLTVGEASKAMGLGATSLRRLIHGGQIPVLRIGGKILLLEQDIEKFLQGCRVTLKEQSVRIQHARTLPDEVLNSPHLN